MATSKDVGLVDGKNKLLSFAVVFPMQPDGALIYTHNFGETPLAAAIVNSQLSVRESVDED